MVSHVRMRVVVLASALLMVWGCGEPVDPSTPDQPPVPQDMTPDTSDTPSTFVPRVKVATFNVRRLFDTTCDSGRCGPNDFESAPTQAELDAQLAKLHEAIATLDADVLILQEVETQAMFEAALGPMLSQYPARAFGEHGTAATLDVGIASRGRLLETRKHRQTRIPQEGGGTTTFAREFLEVHFDFGGERVIVFGAHFVSKSSDLEGVRRVAEAKAAAQLLSARAMEFREGLIVLGGDLNDEPDSDALAAFYALGIRSAIAGKPASEVYTYRFQDRLQSIDHLLFIDQAPFVLDGATVSSFHEGNRSGFGGSDHGALRATFFIPRP